MPQLELFLLGPPRIEYDDQPIEVDTRKAIALLAYLALNGPIQPRDTLAALLWPTSNQARARSALRRTLSVLKKAIGPQWLEVTREQIGLNFSRAGFWLDIAQFQSLLEACQQHGHVESNICPDCLEPLGKAVKLYRGDLLTGFSLRDSPEFDNWQRLEAERLRESLIQTLERLVRGHIARREFERALDYARRWVETDPLNEAAHRQLMCLYAWSDQRNTALQQYQRCRQILQEQLGVTPDEETCQLYQILHKQQVPPLPTILLAQATSPPQHNLPPQPTPFVGRERELAQIRRFLKAPNCRLLTLVGPGGVGKTRLAIQAALEQVDAFRHGVYFVPLALLQSADLLVPAIADALQFSFYGREDLQIQLLNHLHEKELLLVLDNLEHLTSGAGVLSGVLEYAPGVSILATSRQRLNLRWEQLLDVQGLSFPQDGLDKTVQEYDALQLFLQSAQRVQPDLALSEKEQQAAVRICQLVEGLPLGIELAAAWVRAFPCTQIAQEIERSLDFLSTSLQDLPGRHRSMAAVFEHSWKLLSAAEKTILKKLSVFQGGFRREAAEQVAAASPTLLAALVDKSLLQWNPTGRYTLHQLLQQYTRVKLVEDQSHEQVVRGQHSTYYATFVGQREAMLQGREQKQVLEELGEEIENIRAGWNWAVDEGTRDCINRFAHGLYFFYEVRGWYQEGAKAFEEAAAALQQSTTQPGDLALARVLVRLGTLHERLGLVEQARAYMQQGVALLRTLDAPGETAFALRRLSRNAKLGGAFEQALGYAQESLAIYRNLQDQVGVASLLGNIGLIKRSCGDYRKARHYLLESLALYPPHSDDRSIARILNNIGTVDYALGDYTQACEWYQESLQICREIGEKRGQAFALNNLGRSSSREGNYAQARQHFQESLALFQETGDRRGMAYALNNLGETALHQRSYREAEQLCQESLFIRREIGDHWAMIYSLNNLGQIARLLGQSRAAREYFHTALRTSLEIQANAETMDCLVYIAEFEAGNGNNGTALKLAAFVSGQASTKHEARQRADQLLSTLAQSLGKAQVSTARGKIQGQSLAEIVQALLGQAEPG